jgi:uncharacterized protein YlaI
MSKKYSKCGKCHASINMETSNRLALIWATYYGAPGSGGQGHCYLCPKCMDEVKKVLPFI